MNLIEFHQKFATEEACIAHLERARWGENGENRWCPHCASLKTYKFKDGRLYKCGDCRKQFTVKVGTIFSGSKIPLHKWYLAIYLASSLKKGVSSVQLAKYLSVTQKTSWFMLHRIRTAFNNGKKAEYLRGTVEVDETYYGPRTDKAKGNKEMVFGMLERGGEVRTLHLPNTGYRQLMPIIQRSVAPWSTIYSDGERTYLNLRDMRFKHASVNHMLGEYARGPVTTNHLEGFWGIFKRTLYGTYHFVSAKHLGRYAGECAYRFNTRELDDGERFDQWFDQIICRLKWKELVSNA